MIPQVRKILLVLHVLIQLGMTCNTKSIFLTWGIILTRLVTHGNIVSVGWFLGARAERVNPQERRPQEYVWLLVLDSNWLVDRVQPVSNPGLRVTHSWGTSFLNFKVLKVCLWYCMLKLNRQPCPTVTILLQMKYSWRMLGREYQSHILCHDWYSLPNRQE